jgi:phytoene dehydrogenase-like protein
LDDGTAVLLSGTVKETAEGLGSDAAAFRRLIGPLVAGWQGLLDDVLGPLHFPAHPLQVARFGLVALLPVATLARLAFRGGRAHALLAGLSAHAMLPLSWPGTAAFGLILGTVAHAVGWPMARGGSQRLAYAMGAHLRALGGEIVTGHRVQSLDDLPDAKAILFDTAPRQLVQIAGESLPAS